LLVTCVLRTSILPLNGSISSHFRPKIVDYSILRHASSGILRGEYMETGVEDLCTLFGPVLYGRRPSGIARIRYSEVRYSKGRLYHMDTIRTYGCGK